MSGRRSLLIKLRLEIPTLTRCTLRSVIRGVWTNLAEDYVSAREHLAGLLLQRRVGADVAGAADSVGNAVVDLGAEDSLWKVTMS